MKVEQGRQGRPPSSMRRSSRSTRSRRRRTAGFTSPRLPTGRSTTWRPMARRGPSSIRKTNTSGLLRSIRLETCSPAPVTRASSTKSRRTASGSRFYKTTATNVVSLALSRGRSCARRNRIAGPRVPHRSGREGVRADRLAVQGDSRHSSGAGRDHLCRRGQRRRRRSPCPADVARNCCGLPFPRSPPRSPPSPSWKVPSPGPPTPPTGRAARRGGKGAIYRIRPDGLWDTLWETGDDSPFDVLIEPDGSLLVGTGTDGKIFRVKGEPGEGHASRPRDRQAGHRPHSGAVGTRRRGDEQPREAVCAVARRPRGAAHTSRMSVMREPWRAGAPSGGAPAARAGQVQLFTRTGNTATPDDTWSALVEGLHAAPTASRSAARTPVTFNGARRCRPTAGRVRFSPP